MARILQIPVEVKFTTKRLRWATAPVGVTGWRCAMYENLCPVVSVLSPGEFEGISQPLELGEITEEINKTGVAEWQRVYPRRDATEHSEVSRIVREKFGHLQFDALVCYYHNPRWNEFAKKDRIRKIDPWQLRDEFLSLKRHLPELVAFLNKWGAWDSLTLPQLGTGYQFVPRLSLPDSIWQQQAKVREALSSDGTDWLSQHHSFASFSARSEFPYFVKSCETCYEAIETTVSMDFLLGTQFRICARKDCEKPFRMESRHERRYCSQYCAHLESVRRNRKARKRERKGG